MASSNRHWPSMFRSKPCNSHHHHHQWQHDINPYSHHKAPYTSGFEERSPEPKPRWNPKPEQIKILEAIFNSGMVNPPRDEIWKIRAQLQEYGHVGDANVFYWFQNRKSRSKNKQRHHVSARSLPQPTPPPPPSTATAKYATASSSSSSEQSAGSNKASHPTLVQPPVLLPPLHLHGHMDSGGEQFPHQISSQGYSLSVADVAGILGTVPPEHAVSLYRTLWGEIAGREPENVTTKSKTQLHYLFKTGAVAAAGGGDGRGALTDGVTICNANATSSGGLRKLQGMGIADGVTSSIVFINEVAFEVVAKPLNVKEAFGREVILLDRSGQPVLTDEWGITIHPLQHGASYYLV